MLGKKRVHLQQFDIIYLQNPDLTYIRNPERNKIMFMPLQLLKTYIRNLSLFFISFFIIPHTRGISKFDHMFAGLTRYNPKFVSLSKYNPGHMNSSI
jgi:hypothetical protein